jgi:hypothetical protein
MGSINLSRRRSWVNLHRPCEVPSAYLRRITWISPFFLRLFKPNVPADHRFRGSLSNRAKNVKVWVLDLDPVPRMSRALITELWKKTSFTRKVPQ